MKKGFLITFEGGEGCGKSSQIKLFVKYLKENNFDYILSREPGGSSFGEEIRNILLHSKEDISALTEFFLFCASRCDHVEKIIQPALSEGKIVVIDRFYDSSFAYQGYGGGLKVDMLKEINSKATGGLTPDLTFLFDLSYEEGFNRKSKDDKLKDLDRIEQKEKAYHEKVRKGYLELAQKEPERFHIIDASKTIEEINKEIIKIFLKKYKNNY